MKFMHILIVFVLALFPCQAIQAQNQDPNTFLGAIPKIWTVWMFQYGDKEFYKVTLMNVVTGKNGMPMLDVRYGIRRRLFTHEWNPTDYYWTLTGSWGTYDDPLCKAPPYPWVIGKKTTCSTTWKQDGYSGSIEAVSTIEAREVVTVPAGTFDSFQIQSVVVDSRTPRMKKDFVCWFAPAVFNYIRCVVPWNPNFNYDLMGFIPGE